VGGPFEEMLRTSMAALKAAKAGRTWQANSETLQLLLIVSDGRILGEQQPVERLVRDAANEGVLPVLVLLDHFAPPGSAAAGAAAGTAAGGGGAGVSTVPAHSILDIQSTAFVNGKVKMTRYMDSYPLPYYIVLRDMHALPSYLGDALRQWFELVANRNA
jgi:midasin